MTIELSKEVFDKLGFKYLDIGNEQAFTKDKITVHFSNGIYHSLNRRKKVETLTTKEDLQIFMTRNKDWIVVAEGELDNELTFSVNATNRREAEKIVINYINEHDELGLGDNLSIYAYKPKKDEPCAYINI